MKLAEITPVFNFNGHLNKHGEGQIHIKIYSEKRKLVATGIKISPNCWDEKNKKVKNHYSKDYYNRAIKMFCRQFENNAEQLLLTGRPFTINDILTLHENANKANISFTEFIEQDLAKRTDLSIGTLRNHEVFKRRLAEFSSRIEFSDLTFNWLCEFEDFLRKYTFEKNKKTKKLSLTRVDKYLRHLHAYINRAIKFDYIEEKHDPFKKLDKSEYNVAIRQANQKRRFIDPEAVERLEKLTFTEENKHLEYIRDFFLFQCYTGLPYSDMIKLNADHLHYKMKGEHAGYAIKMERSKTKEPVYIPLYLMHTASRAEKILKKYMDSEKPYIFDHKTGEYINRKLKELATMAKISENLSTNVGRHTASMWLLYKGIAMHVVQKILGHTKITTTQIYAMMDERATDQAFINLERKNG